MIFKERDFDRRLFYIVDGKVSLRHVKSKTFLKQVSKDNSFGEIEFFSGDQRFCTAKSESFTDLFYINFEQFDEQL